jgi:hypothetical protein
MDLENVLVHLRQQRDKIEAAILSLERLGGFDPVRRNDLAAKSRTNGLNGYHRPADLAPGAK